MSSAARCSSVAARAANPQTTRMSLFHGRIVIPRLILTILTILLAMSTTSAFEMRARDVSNATYYQELLLQGQLVFDSGTPPSKTQQRKRDDASSSPTPSSTDDSASQVAAITTSAEATATTITVTSTSVDNSTSATSSATPSIAPSDLPTPFDTSLGNNFTNTACPAYFNSFLSNATFQSCLPISMLLQNSMSFFKAVKSPPLLVATLDKSCSASLALCSPLMAHIANELTSSSICGDDFERENPLVSQAHAALVAYEPMFQATCLKDQSTGDYCFAEAMSNSSGAADSYPYYTAVGLALPPGTQPDCTSCLQRTMQVFAGYAVQKDQPLAQTYLNCAIQINQGCGSSFANVAVKAGSVEDTYSGVGRATCNTVMLCATAVLALVWQSLL